MRWPWGPPVVAFAGTSAPFGAVPAAIPPHAINVGVTLPAPPHDGKIAKLERTLAVAIMVVTIVVIVIVNYSY